MVEPQVKWSVGAARVPYHNRRKEPAREGGPLPRERAASGRRTARRVPGTGHVMGLQWVRGAARRAGRGPPGARRLRQAGNARSVRASERAKHGERAQSARALGSVWGLGFQKRRRRRGCARAGRAGAWPCAGAAGSQMAGAGNALHQGGCSSAEWSLLLTRPPPEPLAPRGRALGRQRRAGLGVWQRRRAAGAAAGRGPRLAEGCTCESCQVAFWAQRMSRGGIGRTGRISRGGPGGQAASRLAARAKGAARGRRRASSPARGAQRGAPCVKRIAGRGR